MGDEEKMGNDGRPVPVFTVEDCKAISYCGPLLWHRIGMQCWRFPIWTFLDGDWWEYQITDMLDLKHVVSRRRPDWSREVALVMAP